MGVQRQELPQQGQPQPGPGPRPAPRTEAKPPIPNSPATKFYKAKKGFANYYFNEQEQERLLKAFHKHGDFSKATGDWSVRTTGTLYAGVGPRGKRVVADFTIKSKGAKDRQNDLIQAIVDGLDYSSGAAQRRREAGHAPRSARQRRTADGSVSVSPASRIPAPRASPPALATAASNRSIRPRKARPSPTTARLRVDAEVLRTRHAGVDGKWYFSTNKTTRPARLLGFEIWLDRDEDPCEVYLFDYKDVGGGKLPHRLEIRFGDKMYANLIVNRWKKEVGK